MRLTNRHLRVGAALALGSLCSSAAGATDGPQDLGQRLAQLHEEFDAAQDEVYQAQRAAKTPEEQAVAFQRNPWEGFRERFDALALDAEGTELAADAWATIFTNELRFGEPEPAWEAFQILAHDHASSSQLDGALSIVPGYTSREGGGAAFFEDTLAALHDVSESSARKEARAGALFSLAKILEREEKTREEALGYYRRLVAEYAEVKGPRRTTFGDMAGAALFEAEHLQIGMTAPDFASVDETNTPFNLSDYKGKVVLVDFWGFW